MEPRLWLRRFHLELFLWRNTINYLGSVFQVLTIAGPLSGPISKTFHILDIHVELSIPICLHFHLKCKKKNKKKTKAVKSANSIDLDEVAQNKSAHLEL